MAGKTAYHLPKRSRADKAGAGQAPAAAQGHTLPLLLFMVGFIAYADRQVIALLKPQLDHVLHWRAGDYAAISSWSQIAVGCSLLLSGWIVDRLGLKSSLGGGLTGWSLATLLHAVVRSVGGFVLVRVMLGFFEGVGTPASIKIVRMGFPRERRAHIIGIVNAAPNLAAMLTPLLVTLLYPLAGWRGTFLLMGVVGLVMAGFWFCIVRMSPARPVVEAEPACTDEAGPETGRHVMAFALSKFITDPVWWFLLFWLPDVLHHVFHLGAGALGMALATAYGMAALGSFIGGHGAGLLGHVLPVSREGGRRVVMLLASVGVLPLPFLLVTNHVFLAVLLCGLALAAHQIFAVNLFGFIADSAPASTTGRATGLGAFAGNMGGALMLYMAGWFAQPGHSLMPVLLYGAVAYPLAWLALSFLSPFRLSRRAVGRGAEEAVRRVAAHLPRCPVRKPPSMGRNLPFEKREELP